MYFVVDLSELPFTGSHATSWGSVGHDSISLRFSERRTFDFFCCRNPIRTLRSSLHSISIPQCNFSIMAINIQEIHDLLINVAHQAGQMILSANPNANAEGTKKNCTQSLITD